MPRRAAHDRSGRNSLAALAALGALAALTTHAHAQPAAAPVRPPPRASEAVTAPVPLPVPAPRTTPPPSHSPSRPSRASSPEQGVTVHHAALVPGAATRVTLRGEELTTVPGTFGEPLRAVATLPGVAHSPFGIGFFLVRGTAFENTGFVVDGFPVINLYHLGAGPSVINPRLVSSLDFYPGGYPVQYGRYSGGLIALETAPPPTERVRAEAELDFLRAGALLVVPFDHSRGTLTLAARRSYYETFLPFVVHDLVLSWGDAQLRVDYRLTPRTRIALFAFGSLDELHIPIPGSPIENQFMQVDYRFARGIVSLDHDGGAGGVSVRWAAMLGADTVGQSSAIANADVTGNVVGQRLSVRFAPAPALSTNTGFDMLASVYSLNAHGSGQVSVLGVPIPNTENIALSGLPIVQSSVAGFIEETLRAGPAEFTAGLRVEHVRYRDVRETLAEPRLVARFRVTPRVTLVAASGRFHQTPQPYLLLKYLDLDTPPQRAWQSSLGVELELPWHLEARLTGYFTHLWDLRNPGPLTPDWAIPEFPQSVLPYDHEGRAYGLEVLLRRRLANGLYGWLSYTLSRSERFGTDRAPEVSSGDQTHVLNVAVSWEPAPAWRVGARFQLATGTPTYNIAGGQLEPTTGMYAPVVLPGVDRNPTINQLDVRVDYRFRWGPLRMSAYADVANVYNAANSDTGWVYSADYRARQPGQGLPILPTIGLRGEL